MRPFAHIFALCACLLLTGVSAGRAQEGAASSQPVDASLPAKVEPADAAHGDSKADGVEQTAPATEAEPEVKVDQNGNVTIDPLPRNKQGRKLIENRKLNNNNNNRRRNEVHHHNNNLVRVRGDVEVKKGETIDGNVVVVAGNIKIEGEVLGDVVSVAGEAVINGIVHGTVIAVPGPVHFGPNADVHQDAVAVGAYTRDKDAKLPSLREVPIPEMVPFIMGLKDFVFQGVVLLRPLPPSVKWVWLAHGAIFMILLGLTVLFPKPVQVGASAIANRPVVSIFSGFLTAILFLPVLVLLIVTVVGIVAVPFALVGLGLAAFFGKASVMEYLGQQIGRNLQIPLLESPVVALLVGALVLAGLYMVPVLGLLVWCVATLLGLGAIMVVTASALGSQSSSTPTPTGIPMPEPVAGAGPPPISGAAFPSDPNIPPLAGSAAPSASVMPGYLRRVGFWKRLFASILDWALLIVPSVAMHAFPPFVPLLLIAYFVGMWTWKGTTIGGICLGIKIVRTDGAPIDFAVALVRSLASCFSFLMLFLGFFWAGWDREKQSWHDKIAGTVVVQVPKGVSLL